MELVMCRSCGDFVPIKKHGDEWVPIANDCSECGGTEFIDIKSDTVVQTGD